MPDLFKGLSAFPITPSSSQGVVDTAALSALVTRLCAAKVHSIGLLGSTGTYAYLDRAQRNRAVAAAAAVKASVPLIVGVGALRTDAAVLLAQDAQTAGADGLLLAPVSYTPLTASEVYGHFVAVAEATDLPLCIYNNPSTTHFTFSHDLLAQLAAHPQIKAVKMPLPTSGTIAQELATLRALLPADFAIGYSGDWGCTTAMLAEAEAFYSGLAGALPQMFMSLVRVARAKDSKTAETMNNRIAPLWALCQQYGSLRLAYALAGRLELCRAELPLPLRPLGDGAMATLDQWLSDNPDLAQ